MTNKDQNRGGHLRGIDGQAHPDGRKVGDFLDRTTPLKLLGGLAALGGVGYLAAGVLAGGNAGTRPPDTVRSHTTTAPITATAPVSASNINTWPLTRITVKKGEGAYQIVKDVDPEIVAGKDSNSSQTQALVEEVGSQAGKGGLQTGQQVVVHDLHSGWPVLSEPAKEKPASDGTHVG